MKQQNTECQGVQKEMKQNDTESQYSKQVPMENSGRRILHLQKLEELTDREMKIMKALDAVIRACGHDPQKVDLKALGLKK